MKKLNEYFKVWKNTIFKHTNFKIASQLANKTVQQFNTKLHQMADNCEFGNFKTEIICNCLDIDICNHKLCEHSRWNLISPKTYSLKSSIWAAIMVIEGFCWNTTYVSSYGQQAISCHPIKIPTQQSSKNQPSQLQCAKVRRCGKDSQSIQQCPAVMPYTETMTAAESNHPNDLFGFLADLTESIISSF